MRKGRSKTIAGYEVWLGYEYRAGGDYSLPFRTKDEADAALRLLAIKTTVARAAPGQPKRSLVSDEVCPSSYRRAFFFAVREVPLKRGFR